MPWIDGILQWWLAHGTGACLFGPPLILFSSKAEFRGSMFSGMAHRVGAHGVLYRRTDISDRSSASDPPLPLHNAMIA